ncbi:uncharacterized protein BX664DRAFT_319815 [Halteromyces radiatus]|uniref:uncharacterized protein n=1 Tax=Halteromyces radiatus TaxID=101107 RepID=UPI00221E4D45|nr:uncharacterized protein BX664DRAFT_319815 [Halteromyces radiatus]KAI8098871.1 hypothetical protein BX664DRAFT_319815 [Halteromyces radiatus]
MLHVQESLPHSNSLIFTQPLLASPSSNSIHPQPTISSSRSTRVIEQLQDKWERIQKELAVTRSQLESTKQAKHQHDTQTKCYTESNKQYRVHIQGLMQVLDTKQKTLEGTKRSSVSMESQVKTLKDEALKSRQQLEALRRQEQVLERERDIAVTKKEQWERQRIVLGSSLQQLERRLDREAGNLREQLKVVQERAHAMSVYHNDFLALVAKTMERYVMDRADSYQQLERAKHNLEHQRQQWIQTTQSHLVNLTDAIGLSGTTTDEFHVTVNRCRGEVNGLIMKIRAYTVMVE